MRLIIEPSDGVAPIISAIRAAKKSVEIAIFRFDYGPIESALKAAVTKGVKVSALIANTNRGGVKNLRELEMRFLAAGIVVARTDNDLIRYHDKYIIIDRSTLYMLSFNFTRLDIDRTRGFGIVTNNARLVEEAITLFETDSTRRPYTPKLDTFVVSPANSRKVLGTFLKRAKKQLLIFDPKISDKEMIGILRNRAKAGVEVRVIGRLPARTDFAVRKPTAMRLHTRTIIRDHHQAFIGSQSLRSAELDTRRELGLVVRDSKIVKKLVEIFEADWIAHEAKQPKKESEVKKEDVPDDVPKMDMDKAADALTQELRPMSVTLKKVVKKVVAEAGEEAVEEKMVKNTVKKMVKKVVKEAVEEVAQETREIEESA